jgi:DNA-binding FrmR family transcriptional regulator
MPVKTQQLPTREEIAHRLARLAGHAQSLKRLWEEERDYQQMLIQIAAVRSGLDQVARAILEQYLHERIQEAVAQGDPSLATQGLREALDRLLL